jgi:hypothetical protein
MNPTRELAAGDRPLDWAENTEATNEDEDIIVGERRGVNLRGSVGVHGAEGVFVNRGEVELNAGDRREARGAGLALPDGGPVLARRAELSLPDGPAPASPTRVGPQRYKVQFTASEEYVKLVEAAKALLSHFGPARRHRRDPLARDACPRDRARAAEVRRDDAAATARSRHVHAGGASTRTAPPMQTRWRRQIGYRARAGA